MEIEQKTLARRPLFLQVLFIVLVALVYFLVAKLGLYLASINHSASPVWPATGFGLFAVLVGGPWMGIGVFLGAFAANFTTGVPLAAVFAIGVGNSGEALLGVWIFHHISKATERLGPHSKLINYVAVATLASVLSASIGSLALYFAHALSIVELRYTWLTWWVGDTLGALILFPIAVLISKGQFSLSEINSEKIGKVMITVLMPLGLGAFVFGTSVGSPFLFVIFLALLLASLWFTSSWIYVTSVIICAISIVYTRQNMGPFTGDMLNENLLHLQLFLAGVGLTAIVLSVLRQEGFLRSPSLALLFGWFLTGMVFYSFYYSGTRSDESYFAHQTEEATTSLKEHLNNYIRLIESGAALFAASEDITPADWKAFIAHLRIEEQYPGIDNIGVIVATNGKAELARLVKEQKKNGFLNFQPHPVMADAETSIEDPPLDLTVKYVEPLAPNAKVIGLQSSTERRRLESALRARDLGVSTITEQITLTRNNRHQAGVILFSPFYKKGMPTSTVETRRAAFQGLVFAPMAVEQFVISVLKPVHKIFDLRVFFGPATISAKRIYSSTSDESIWPKSRKSEIDFAGQTVTILWKRGPEFKTQSSMIASWAGFVGALISICLAVLLSSLEHLAERAQNIAEKRNYELSQRERLWRALSESSPMGIYLSDEKGQTTYINPTFSKLLGHSLSEITKIGWSKFFHPEDVERIYSEWYSFIQFQSGAYAANYRMVSGSKVLHICSQAVPLRNEQGVITGFVGTIQDLTELHEKQVALMASSRMSSLGEMAGGVAHEINNPLAIIAGKSLHLDLILQKDSVDILKAQSHIRVITSNVERIAKIIRGLRTIARDVPDDPFREVKAKDILQDTLELCRSRFKHHDVSLLLPVVISENVKCLARPEQIVQVLLNLLNNAFDAVSSLDEKWVKIDVQSFEGKIQISVTDSGRALSAEVQEKIFVPFFTTKEVGKGTGLGLSISRSIIEKHNGRLFVDDQSANTKFVMELNTQGEREREREISA